MKHSIFLIILLVIFSNSVFSISPVFKLGEKSTPLNEVASEIQEALKSANYEILGSYNVGGQSDKMVIVFTNADIKKLALSYSNRGGLAIAQKVGLIHSNGETTVSLINPLYMFHAYFQDDFKDNATKLTSQVDAIKGVFSSLGYDFTPFGGDLSADDLHDYQYMFGMPEFTDPVELETYDSFNEGVKTIKANLKAKKGNTVKVYELIFADKKVAVFGVGLLDKENGETNFLSIIGEDHLAAMPYEIILQDKEATMLHGRFRFALYWPELTMSTFTKIMSTPGYVEDVLEEIAD